MEENGQKSVVNHFEAGSNCQVFNGNITGCTFAMPGSNVTQQAVQPAESPVDPSPAAALPRDEKLCLLIHPSIPAEQEWQIHDELQNLVTRQGIQDICRYLKVMALERKSCCRKCRRWRTQNWCVWVCPPERVIVRNISRSTTTSRREK